MDHYASILSNLQEQKGMLQDIFNQAMPRFNNPVNLKRLIGLIDDENWSALDVDVKGQAFEGYSRLSTWATRLMKQTGANVTTVC
jgi:type I restriction enzyme M protein